MPSGGSIINISTGGTKAALPLPVYTSSKLALEGLHVTLARELAAKGIRINTVSPGYTDTEMLASSGPEMTKVAIEASVFKRLGKWNIIRRLRVRDFFFLDAELAGFATLIRSRVYILGWVHVLTEFILRHNRGRCTCCSLDCGFKQIWLDRWSEHLCDRWSCIACLDLTTIVQ